MPSASSTEIAVRDPTKPAVVTRTISDAEQKVVDDILREFAQYQIWRNTYAGQCEEVAELILPTSRNTFFYGNFNWPGSKKTQQQVRGPPIPN